MSSQDSIAGRLGGLALPTTTSDCPAPPALTRAPQLIYLDEPALGVDVQSRDAIWDYIVALRDK